MYLQYSLERCPHGLLADTNIRVEFTNFVCMKYVYIHPYVYFRRFRKRSYLFEKRTSNRRKRRMRERTTNSDYAHNCFIIEICSATATATARDSRGIRKNEKHEERVKRASGCAITRRNACLRLPGAALFDHAAIPN